MTTTKRERRLVGRVCAAWYPVACRHARRGREDGRGRGLSRVRHGRANDHGRPECLIEWDLVGTRGLWFPLPPPPEQSPEANQSQTADEQHKRRRHLHGVAHEVDDRLCADRRRGGEDQEQRQDGASPPHVAIKSQRKCQMLPGIRRTQQSEKLRTSRHTPRNCGLRRHTDREKSTHLLRAGHRGQRPVSSLAPKTGEGSHWSVTTANTSLVNPA